ncbi:hypothetical protein FRC05_006360 [Tulasnella sp. 425]|nr:hypothetical protein FRC05_006360 [Tulasnella sp. 425]
MPISTAAEAPAPAPAAGPSNLRSLLSVPLVGRLRIVSGNSRAGAYISRRVEPDMGVLLTCHDAAEALTVRITPSTSMQGIEILDFPFPYNWLGSLRDSYQSLSHDFSGYSNLIPVSRPDSRPVGTNVAPLDGEVQAAIWSYNAIDDSIQALLPDGGCRTPNRSGTYNENQEAMRLKVIGFDLFDTVRYIDLAIDSLFNVTGKVAVVTGGSSGIGEMIATALVQNGAKVHISSRKEPELKKVTDRLNRAYPGSCHYLVADLSSKAGCDSLAEEIKSRENKIHVLVNCSGISWGAPWDNVPEKQGWDRIMAVNVKALFYLTVALTDLLAKDSTAEDPARVINISSNASFSAHADDSAMGNRGNGVWAYSTSKAAVNHLTRLMAVTLSKKYITVNAICPGMFPSRMTNFVFKEASDSIARNQPLGRFGNAQDMAGLVLFLVSKASRHVNGAAIPLDGGAFIHGRQARVEFETKSKL